MAYPASHYIGRFISHWWGEAVTDFLKCMEVLRLRAKGEQNCNKCIEVPPAHNCVRTLYTFSLTATPTSQLGVS